MSFFWSNLNNDIRLFLPYGDIVFLPDINGDYLADDYECRWFPYAYSSIILLRWRF